MIRLKNLLLFLFFVGSIASVRTMEHTHEDPQKIINQLTAVTQGILDSSHQGVLRYNKFDILPALTKELNDCFTQTWYNNIHFTEVIRNSISSSLINNLMIIGAREALVNLSTILTPAQKGDAPSPGYERIREALLIPSEVYNEIVEARTTGCFKELLALKRRQDIAGTHSEKIITQTIVDLMGGIYQIPPLKTLALHATAFSFDQLINDDKWKVIKAKLTHPRLPQHLSRTLINLPINRNHDSLLMRYTEKKDVPVVQELVEGIGEYDDPTTKIVADPNVKNCTNSNALTIACSQPNNTLIQLLAPVTDECATPQPNYGLMNKTSLQQLSKTMGVDPSMDAIRQALLRNNTEALQFWVSNYPKLLESYPNCTLSLLDLIVQSPYGYRIFPLITQEQTSLKSKFFQRALTQLNVNCIKHLLLNGAPVSPDSYNSLFCIGLFTGDRKIENGEVRQYTLLHLLWNAGAQLPQTINPLPGHPNFLHYLLYECNFDKSSVYTLLTFLREKKYNNLDLPVVNRNNQTVLEAALLEKHAFFINFIVQTALEQKVTFDDSVQKERLMARYMQNQKPITIYHIFLNAFLSIFASSRISEGEKFSCIKALSGLECLKSTPSTEKNQAKHSYDMFVSSINFGREEINLDYSQALNLGFFCNNIKYLLFTLEKMHRTLSPEQFVSLCSDSAENTPLIGRLITTITLNPDQQYPLLSLIKKILQWSQQLKTKKDYFNKTPWDYIKENDLSRHKELITLFGPEEEKQG